MAGHLAEIYNHALTSAIQDYLNMNTKIMAQQQIRITGIKILSQSMGATKTIRFLQQAETGYGDYTNERDKILGDPPLEDLIADIKAGSLNIKK